MGGGVGRRTCDNDFFSDVFLQYRKRLQLFKPISTGTSLGKVLWDTSVANDRGQGVEESMLYFWATVGRSGRRSGEEDVGAAGLRLDAGGSTWWRWLSLCRAVSGAAAVQTTLTCPLGPEGGGRSGGHSVYKPHDAQSRVKSCTDVASGLLAICLQCDLLAMQCLKWL